jgi:hypothetical protein
MDDEVMRFEITDQDLEDEMTTSYGQKRYFWVGTVYSMKDNIVSRC